ncbi:MAG TPA: hypothetical protein VFE53_20030 [Mucilaginibacter sp.]|nr:hypothetical protein [Mucilaginibacter sp.]
MHTKLLLYPAFFCLLAFAFSCKKNQQPQPETVAPPSAIYIAGGIGGNAVYWKNGIAVNLPVSTPSVSLRNTFANDVFISGDDVYISGDGQTTKKTDTAFYWKNDVLSILSGTSEGDQNYAIAVAGSNVYCGGHRYDTSDGQGGVLWKNGAANSFGSAQTTVNSITVNNDDVYTSGPDEYSPSGPWIATYYKNQQKVLLYSNGMRAWAYEVAVSGTDIYVAGSVVDDRDSSFAVYWKNGDMHMIGGAGSGASSICVSGSDVYTYGSDLVNGRRTATYWKNNTAVHLVTNAWAESECNQIRVWGNDVYAVGEAFYTDHGDQATVWKNGVGTIIGPYVSFASTIAFKP